MNWTEKDVLNFSTTKICMDKRHYGTTFNAGEETSKDLRGHAICLIPREISLSFVTIQALTVYSKNTSM